VFENFLADMGPRNGLTIERIDNNGDYGPDNCRWATQKEQCQNKSNTYTPEQDQKLNEALAMGYTLREAAGYVGKSFHSVVGRASRLGLKSIRARKPGVVGSPKQREAK
jgi:hypothetical protein